MLGNRQALHIGAEHSLTRVGQRVHRMSHSVDQPLAVKRFPVKYPGEIHAHLFPVSPIRYMGTDIIHHLHDLDVRSAVAGSL